jgi:hypothetical protein
LKNQKRNAKKKVNSNKKGMTWSISSICGNSKLMWFSEALELEARSWELSA